VFHRPLRRPLAAVSLLALADYLLWNWSLDGSHDILALVSGLTLVPLLIALAWLIFVGATRLLAAMTRRAQAISTARAVATAARRRRARARAHGAGSAAGTRRSTAAARSARERHAVAGTGAGEKSPQASPSSKLAA
jgi:hypothetical protein